jgi:pimeloyl-ACP methyl ester carboxylesterase
VVVDAPWRRASRRFRGAWRLAHFLVSAVVLLSTATACHGRGPVQAHPAVPALPRDVCVEQPAREGCDQIQLAGVSWRYLFLSSRSVTADTVVVDFGGPGTAVLSGSANVAGFHQNHPQISARYNILIVEEPWVVRDISAECRRSLAEYYLGLRQAVAMESVARQAGELRQRCGLNSPSHHWGFDASTYHQVVAAIAKKRSLHLVGYVGHSWGATRLGYLSDVAFEWAVLVRPYPVGLPIDDVLDRRESVLRQQQSSMLARSPASVRDIEQRRALPVTEFDRLSALVEMGYVEGSSRDSVGPGIAHGTNPGRVGLLSDELWGRSGYHNVSPRMLAFLEEACSMAGVPRDSARDGLGLVLRLQYAACTRDSTRHTATPRTAARLCVVLGTTDSVTPETLGRRAFADVPGVLFATSAVGQHTSFDGIEDCLARVG